MAKGAPGKIEKRAYEVVREAEIRLGWTPGPQLSQTQQKAEGCDFFSTPPGGGDPHPVEVKGWGEPLRRSDGEFTWWADLRVEQLERARSDPRWRLEIVANLTAAAAGEGQPERHSLTAAEVVERAHPWVYKVPL